MTGALILWGAITLGGGILQLLIDPAKAARARADREAAARIAAETEASIARRRLATMTARSIAHPAHPDRPYLGPRRRRSAR